MVTTETPLALTGRGPYLGRNIGWLLRNQQPGYRKDLHAGYKNYSY
jgi:hypothetical protein